MKASVERQTLHVVVKRLLQALCFANSNVCVAFIAAHQNATKQKAGSVFKHQQLPAKLNGLTCLATFVQLCVRFKDAEQFVAVRNRLVVDHSSPSRVGHAFGSNNKRLQRVGAKHVCQCRGWLANDHAQVASALRQKCRFLQ